MAFTVLDACTLPCGNLRTSHSSGRQRNSTCHGREGTLQNHGAEKMPQQPGHRKQLHVDQRVGLIKKAEPNNIELHGISLAWKFIQKQ